MNKFVQQIINSRQWVDILFGLPIQCTIINSHSRLSGQLPDKDDRNMLWATGWLNPTLSQIFTHLSSQLCWFSWRHHILASVVKFSIGEKLYVMHHISIHWHARWIKDIMELLYQFVLSRGDLNASKPLSLTVTNHLPGDKFTVGLQQHVVIHYMLFWVSLKPITS